MIESALYEHLQNQERLLSPYLASYGGNLAIFNQEAPADTDEGWHDPSDDDEDEELDEPAEMYSERVKTSQYGRLVFAVDLSDDPERKYSGTLSVDILCEKGVQLPEEIEPIVRSLIDGYFFSTEEITMAAQWSASNYFTEPTNKIIGVTLTFGLLAFPKQTTIYPDPIALLNEWSGKELKDILWEKLRVIGHDPLEAAWKPTNEAPAVYWRLTNINPCGWIPDTYHCSWHTAVISGHILAPDKGVCASIARKIDNILTIKKRLIFDDKSPLMVDRNIRVNLSHDPMKVGQITLDATYGILRLPKPCNKLNHLSVSEERRSPKMASEAEKIIPEVKQEEKNPVFIPKNLKKEFEATYTIPELVEAADTFGTTKLVVRAALAKAGKESYTMKEAKNLIERLKNKEVKRNGI